MLQEAYDDIAAGRLIDHEEARRRLLGGQLGSSFDDFLREEGIYEEVTAAAIKEVLAWQIDQSRRDQGLSGSSALG